MGKNQKRFTEDDLSLEFLFEAKQHFFENSKNPVYALEAFLIADKAGSSPPSWVLSWIGDAFKKYHASLGNEDLDKLLGFKRGRGENKAFKDIMINERNSILLGDMARLRAYFDISVEEASFMVFRREEETSDSEFNKTALKIPKISDRRLQDLYNSNPWCEEWRKEIKKVGPSLEKRQNYLKYFPKDSLPLRLQTRFK
jgi:hypothetical protein